MIKKFYKKVACGNGMHYQRTILVYPLKYIAKTQIILNTRARHNILYTCVNTILTRYLGAIFVMEINRCIQCINIIIVWLKKINFLVI